jgi:hypothetical protein
VKFTLLRVAPTLATGLGSRRNATDASINDDLDEIPQDGEGPIDTG